LLRDLARLAAVLVRSEQQSEELRESRARIVAGREEERRSLRRDLHDGIGPALAAIVLKLNAVRSRTEPEREALLAEARNEVRAAIAELRRLNQPVPVPAAAPTAAELDAAEQRLGVRFHPDLRRFQLEASDVVCGTLEPGRVGAGDHTDLEMIVRDAREQEGFPAGLFPFCEDNGDYYALTSQGRVVFWSHDGPVDQDWPDLASWIEQVWIGESQEEQA